MDFGEWRLHLVAAGPEGLRRDYREALYVAELHPRFLDYVEQVARGARRGWVAPHAPAVENA